MLEMWRGLSRGEDELFTSLLHRATQFVVHRVDQMLCGATYEGGCGIAPLSIDTTRRAIEVGALVPVTTVIPVDYVFDARRTIQVYRVLRPTEKET